MHGERVIYQFANFELDPSTRELKRDDLPLSLEPRVFDLLLFLIERRERVVSKQELFDNIWKGRIVSDAALTSAIKAAREVLGDEYVDAKMANVDDFTADFQQMVTEYGWGASWARGVLARRERSILNLGMLAALNRPDEFRLHFKGAINNGLSVVELREICMHIAIYCGIPASIEAFKLAREVFDAEGIDVSVIPEDT